MNPNESTQAAKEPSKLQDDSIIDKTQYEILAARRQSHDEMMWQTPVLSLTAQAFLFTIALGSGVHRGPQILSSILALCCAIASIHLMIKHRHFEVESSEWLAEYEHAKQIKMIHGKPSHQSWFLKSIGPSYYIWLGMLGTFALGASAILFVPCWFR